MEIARQARSTDGCSHSEDGTCAFHNEEMEKRGKVEVKIAFLMGSSFLIGLILSGSFIYTSGVKDDITASQVMHQEIYRKKFERMTREVSTLTSTTSVLVNASKNTNKSLDRTNQSLDRLASIIERSMGVVYTPHQTN